MIKSKLLFSILILITFVHSIDIIDRVTRPTFINLCYLSSPNDGVLPECIGGTPVNITTFNSGTTRYINVHKWEQDVNIETVDYCSNYALCDRSDADTIKCMDRYWKGLPVNGTAAYCSCHDCSPSNCVCKNALLTDTDVINWNGNYITVFPQESSFGVMYTRIFKDQWHSRALRSVDVSEDSEVVLYEYDETNKIIYIHMSKNAVHYLSFQMTARDYYIFSVSVDEYTLTYAFEIPSDWYEYTDVIRVYVLKDAQLISQTSFTIIGEQDCIVIDCFFCWNSWNNFVCMSSFNKWLYRLSQLAFFILLVTLILLLVYFFIVFFFWSCIKCMIRACMFLFVCHKTKLGMNFKKRYNEVKEKVKREFSPMQKEANDIKPYENMEDSVTDELEEFREFERNAYLSFPKSRTVIFAMMLLFVSGCYCQCTETFNVGSESIQCMNDGNSITCSIFFNELLSVPLYGTSCIRFFDTGQNYLGQLMVTYTKAAQYISYSSIYYTMGWEHNFVNIKRCEGAIDPKCCDSPCDDTDCNYVSSYNDASLCGQNTNSINQGEPGISKCFEYDDGGSSFNSCPFHAFRYCRDAIQTDQELYLISERDQKRFVPTIAVTWIWYNGTEMSETLDFVEDTLTTSGGFIRYLGSLIGDSFPSLDSYCLMTGDNQCYLEECSPLNQPAENKLGDVQTSTGYGVSIYAPGLVTPVFTGNDCKPKDSNSFLRNYWLHPQPLPRSVDGALWNCNDNVINAHLDSVGPALLQLTYNGELTTVSTITPLCPDLVSIDEVSGCLSQSNSVLILFSAHSTCGSGTSSIKISELFIPDPAYCIINSTVQQYNVLVNLGINGEYVLKLYAGARSSSLTFEVDLEECDIYVDPIYEGYNATTYDYDSSDNGLIDEVDDLIVDFFNGAATWLEYLVVGIFIFLLLICFVVCLLLTCYYVVYACALSAFMKLSNKIRNPKGSSPIKNDKSS